VVIWVALPLARRWGATQYTDQAPAVNGRERAAVARSVLRQPQLGQQQRKGPAPALRPLVLRVGKCAAIAAQRGDEAEAGFPGQQFPVGGLDLRDRRQRTAVGKERR